jgi:hypothetical protein
MPRWVREKFDPLKVQTCVLDCSQYSLHEGSTEEQELEVQLRKAEHLLTVARHKRSPKILLPNLNPPPGAEMITDWDEERKELVVVGYRVRE